MNTASKKQVPLPVRHALAALEILRDDTTLNLHELEKTLPAYAQRLAQSGENPSIEDLVALARQGEEAIKQAFVALRPAQETRTLLQEYTRIVAEMSAPPTTEPVINLTAANVFALSIAAQKGDDASVKRLFEESAVARGNELGLAAEAGHISTVQLLLEHRADVFDIDNALYLAATKGQEDVVRLLFSHGATLNANNYTYLFEILGNPNKNIVELFLKHYTHDKSCINKALIKAASVGALETVTLLLDHGADPNFSNLPALTQATAYPDIVRLLIEHGADIHLHKDRALGCAAQNGHIETLRILLEHGADIHADNNTALRAAARSGRSQAVELLLENGADIKSTEDIIEEPLLNARYEVVDLLLQHGASINTAFRQILLHGTVPHQLSSIALCLDHGADVSVFAPEQQQVIQTYIQRRAHWQDVVRVNPPSCIHLYDPTPFKPKFFQEVMTILEKEGLHGTDGHPYAYAVMAVLQNEKRLLQYLQKWGTPSKLPLHDVIHMMKLPKTLSGADLSAWGDAILQHGPKMAQLVKFCDRMARPIRSEDGKSWSYLRTRAQVAAFSYARGTEHPQLAELCFEHAIDEADFNTALDIVQSVPPKKRDMPEITIDGARFGLEGATFKKLVNDDVRGLFLGELTDCCQSIGNHGNDCAEHGYSSPNGGFYVVETADGEIIGQSWAWRGVDGELCLDSLETLGTRISSQQWKALLDETARELTQRNTHGVSALHVGIGGATPDSLKDAFNQVEAKPIDYGGYRDSRKQIRVWKR